MELSSDDMALIRTGWAKIAPVAPMAARLFYGRLFRLAPETRGLFTADLAAQGAKLTATLGFIVDHLDRPETLVPAARELALRHRDYGVSPAHYTIVGEALLWTLAELLGPAFGRRERGAWLAAYAGLSTAMIEAAHGHGTGA